MKLLSESQSAERIASRLDADFWRNMIVLKTARSDGIFEYQEEFLQRVKDSEFSRRVGLSSFPTDTFVNSACEVLFGSRELSATSDPLASLPVSCPDFYLSVYSDLQGAFGVNNYTAATQHWLSSGIREGRKSSPAFDVAYYLSRHDDLVAAFGSSGYYAAVNYWLAHLGVETRRTSEVFDVAFYLNKYIDVDTTVGNRAGAARAAILHWICYGMFEGKQASDSFDSRYYLTHNPDLIGAFGHDNWSMATIHWLKLGISEGRKGVGE